MKLSKPPQAHRLRRRTKLAANVELCRNYCLILLLFGCLAVIFTPPTNLANESGIRGSTGNANANDETHNQTDTNDDDSAGNHYHRALTVVRCEVSTPHSKTPNQAAAGTFDIGMLPTDVARKGSSAHTFVALVDEHFYDGCYTFRVLPRFVVQFGHRADDKKTYVEQDADATKQELEAAADATHAEEKDASLQRLKAKSNTKGTIAMVRGPTGQVFVNTGDNFHLDLEGTLPFGVILEPPNKTDKDADKIVDSKHFGMGLLENIHPYKPGQGQIPAVNNHEVPEKFPEMGRIDRCYRLK